MDKKINDVRRDQWRRIVSECLKRHITLNVTAPFISKRSRFYHVILFKLRYVPLNSSTLMQLIWYLDSCLHTDGRSVNLKYLLEGCRDGLFTNTQP